MICRYRLSPRPPARRRRLRSSVAALPAALTSVLLVASLLATWTSGTALSTSAFVKRVGAVIDEPAVRDAISTEISTQLISVLNVQGRLAPALPKNLQFLAAALATGVDKVVTDQTNRLVNSKAFRDVWFAALTLAHQQVVTALTGSGAHLQIYNGKIYVDLLGIVTQVLQNLQNQLPTIFGTVIASQIPTGTPANAVRALLSRALGVSLPPTFASVPVLDASGLHQARKGFRVINFGVVLLLVLTVVGFALALWVSVRRRRTLVEIGLWTAGLTGIVAFAVRALTRSAVSGIARPALQPAVAARRG
jgi:hypothetical protein